MKATFSIDDTVMEARGSAPGTHHVGKVETALRLLLRSQRKRGSLPVLPSFHRSDLQVRNCAIDRDVAETAVGMHAEIGHVVKHVARPGTAGKFDVQEIGAANVAEPE